MEKRMNLSKTTTVLSLSLFYEILARIKRLKPIPIGYD